MKLPTLFGLTTKGKVKEWSVRVEGDTFIVTHGQQGGKMQEKRTVCKPKNVGKKNETSPEEQAILEAKAKWKKQLDKNYHEDLENAKPTLNPMLAMDYNKAGHRISYPCYAQRKLDGVRCLIMVEDGEVKFKSRGGKEYPVIQRIADELMAKIFFNNIDLVLDGELYAHGESLQTIVSAVKKHNDDTAKIKFHIFDLAVEGIPWDARLKKMQGLDLRDEEHNSLFEEVVFETTPMISDVHWMFAVHEQYVDEGYEGIMLRNRKGLYKFDSRSADLQKFKKMMDAEFTIVGHEIDKDGCVVWVVEVPTDDAPLLCKVTPKMSKADRKELAKVAETYYSKQLKVQFQTYTDDGNLQFPVGIELDRTDHE